MRPAPSCARIRCGMFHLFLPRRLIMKGLFWFLFYALLSALCVTFLFPALRIAIDAGKMYGPSIWEDILSMSQSHLQFIRSFVEEYNKNSKETPLGFHLTVLVMAVMVMSFAFFEKYPAVYEKIKTSQPGIFLAKWRPVMLPYIPGIALLYLMTWSEKMHTLLFALCTVACFLVGGIVSFFTWKTLREKQLPDSA